MSAHQKEGICHICGQHGKLSFEHVPPKAAFNKRPILIAELFDDLAGHPIRYENLDSLSSREQQKGAGRYTLCVRCNSITGTWYGPAYVEWVTQGMEIVHRVGRESDPSFNHEFKIHPLRVIKQVVCMFLSKNPPSFGQKHQDLVDFVLGKNNCNFPDNIRIYAFYTFSNRSRSTAVSVVLKGLLDGNAQTLAFSEITFPPFGFVLALGSQPPDDCLCDITRFCGFDYDDQRSLWLQMPIMPIYTWIPGDYRNREEVNEQANTQLNFAQDT